MTQYLGIDYGLAHLGLALAEHTLATPLPFLPNDSKLLSRLHSLCSQHQVTQIIVGLPTGPLESAVRQFALLLQNHLALPVTLHDETLSSYEAQQKLRHPGVSAHKRRHDHSYAAALILEDYLESVKLT
ncbi:MAG: hypothetical protein ACD_27C00007G0002 [uncultured bacterium]|nr:MAG: hypothetical protein ACD_27C00007G0002 [uncultured bacterium]